MGNSIFDENNGKKSNISEIIYNIILILTIELIVGIIGFHIYNNLNWIDSFKSASLIIPGVAENIPATTMSGKLFTSIFSLITGFITFVIIAILVGEIIINKFNNVNIN